MAQQLRALAAFAEDLGSIPRTHRVTTSYNSSSGWGIWCPLLASAGTCTQMVHTYTEAYTYAYKINLYLDVVFHENESVWLWVNKNSNFWSMSPPLPPETVSITGCHTCPQAPSTLSVLYRSPLSIPHDHLYRPHTMEGLGRHSVASTCSLVRSKPAS